MASLVKLSFPPSLLPSLSLCVPMYHHLSVQHCPRRSPSASGLPFVPTSRMKTKLDGLQSKTWFYSFAMYCHPALHTVLNNVRFFPPLVDCYAFQYGAATAPGRAARQKNNSPMAGRKSCAAAVRQAKHGGGEGNMTGRSSRPDGAASPGSGTSSNESSTAVREADQSAG